MQCQQLPGDAQQTPREPGRITGKVSGVGTPARDRGQKTEQLSRHSPRGSKEQFAPRRPQSQAAIASRVAI